jgi:RNA exonuclease 4
MNGSTLSSNWKQLQARLKAEPYSPRSPPPPTDRAASNTAAVTGKRKRVSNSAAGPGPGVDKKEGKRARRDGPKAPVGKTAENGSVSKSSSKSDYGQKSKHFKMNGHTPTLATTNGTTTATNSPLHNVSVNAGLTPSLPLGKYIALDCEMVGTSLNTSILARASLTTYTGAQLYDSYVLPRSTDAPITDYRTPISGITPSMLRPGVARPFEEVHSTIKALLKGRVLVGHDLKHDLRVLDNLKHPKADTRDTALYRKFRDEVGGGGWPRLKDLAERYLGLGDGEFQGGDRGHSSVEDARVAMMLFRLEKVGIEGEVRGRFGVGVAKGAKVAANSDAFLDGPGEGDGVGRQGSDSGDNEDGTDDHDEDEDQDQNGVAYGHHTSSKPKKKKGNKKKKKKRK